MRPAGRDARSSRATYIALALAMRALTELPLLGMFLLIHFDMRGDGGGENVLWNAGGFAAWAALHSLLARDAARRLLSRCFGPDYVRIAYVAVAGLTLVVLLLAWRPVSGELWHARGPAAWALSAAYVGALVGLVYASSQFDYAEFLGLGPVKSRVAGRPPRAPSLSVQGPYAYCRHPMYLAMLAAFWVGPVMSGGRLELAALSTVYILVGLRLEERNLRRELGPAYDEYRAHVPMLVPRLRPWTQRPSS